MASPASAAKGTWTIVYCEDWDLDGDVDTDDWQAAPGELQLVGNGCVKDGPNDNDPYNDFVVSCVPKRPSKTASHDGVLWVSSGGRYSCQHVADSEDPPAS